MLKITQKIRVPPENNSNIMWFCDEKLSELNLCLCDFFDKKRMIIDHVNYILLPKVINAAVK